ncbi:MAG: hypothetical protein R2705_15350 [Ilumatobacteraceae bacterium]
MITRTSRSWSASTGLLPDSGRTVGDGDRTDDAAIDHDVQHGATPLTPLVDPIRQLLRLHDVQLLEQRRTSNRDPRAVHIRGDPSPGDGVERTGRRESRPVRRRSDDACDRMLGLSDSAAAARRIIRSASHPSIETRSVTTWFAQRVPVLSNMTASIVRICSSASRSLIRIPASSSTRPW